MCNILLIAKNFHQFPRSLFKYWPKNVSRACSDSLLSTRCISTLPWSKSGEGWERLCDCDFFILDTHCLYGAHSLTHLGLSWLFVCFLRYPCCRYIPYIMRLCRSARFWAPLPPSSEYGKLGPRNRSCISFCFCLFTSLSSCVCTLAVIFSFSTILSRDSWPFILFRHLCLLWWKESAIQNWRQNLTKLKR